MLRIGTSGYQYRHWRNGVFYPERLPSEGWLAFYAQRFATVELNVTFYRLPASATFAAWRRTVPDGFVFAVKASRYLTHVRRLRDPREPVELLLERASLLGDRLGPILIQLPPDMTIELERLAETLSAFPPTIRVAVEPRHDSWFVPELRELLTTAGAALCLADRRGPRTPIWRTADWTYARFHGGTAQPRPCYGETSLTRWVGRLRQEWGAGIDGYAYFNNDFSGCAPRDAATFAALAEAEDIATSRTSAAGRPSVAEESAEESAVEDSAAEESAGAASVAAASVARRRR